MNKAMRTLAVAAPAGTCMPGDHATVPYTADYFFWKYGN